MIPALLVHSAGRAEWIQPDGASLAWVELTMGANYSDIPEYVLRLCLAYYFHQHHEAPDPVTWADVHAWARAAQINVTVPDA